MPRITVRIASLLASIACGTTTFSVAADTPAPQGARLSCVEARAEKGLTQTEQLELIVNLAYHSIQSRQPGLRLSGPQNAVLGLVIEEACRQAPEADLGATVDMAVSISLDANPGAAERLAAR